jgi:GGDEF domain-containing protein
MAWYQCKRLNSGADDTANTLIYSYDITSYIEQFTLIDPLTGLYNFTKFIVEGDKLIKSNHHDQYVLIYADINDFRYTMRCLAIKLVIKFCMDLHVY